MGRLINNASIHCTACGHGPFQGRESSSKRKDGSIYQECRWICPRCARLVRLDDRIITATKKED